jgi:deazaflavin-dependent oxidoreductase (nitroreductase family)
VTKRRASTFFTAKILNPVVRTAVRLGLPLPLVVILETRGRKSGQLRQIPVGKTVDGDTLWIVAEHGRKASYMQNIEADPHVRVRVGRRWRTGTEHVTVRVDLDPASGAPRSAGPAPQ